MLSPVCAKDAARSGDGMKHFHSNITGTKRICPMLATTFLLVTALPASVGELQSLDIPNEHVLIDMTQNNPGDAVAWQQSKYFDPRTLKQAGYTGQCATGEISGTQSIDFHSTGFDFFPEGSAQRLWLDAYSGGVRTMLERARTSGIKTYFFVDLVVFPTFVIDHYREQIAPKGKILWNNMTKNLVQVFSPF